MSVLDDLVSDKVRMAAEQTERREQMNDKCKQCGYSFCDADERADNGLCHGCAYTKEECIAACDMINRYRDAEMLRDKVIVAGLELKDKVDKQLEEQAQSIINTGIPVLRSELMEIDIMFIVSDRLYQHVERLRELNDDETARGESR